MNLFRSKKFWALLVIGALGVWGYQTFQHKYEKDRRFHRRVDRKLKPFRDFWRNLTKPIGGDTSKMDARHAQRIHATGGSYNRMNQQERQMQEGMAGGMMGGMGMPVETEEQRQEREWNENYD